MSTHILTVQYENKFGRPLQAIRLSLRDDQLSSVHLLITDAGNKAFGNEWGRAVYRAGKGRRSMLVVENGRR